jgi:hypothetical protein
MRAVRESEIEVIRLSEAMAKDRFQGGTLLIGHRSLTGLSHR